MINPTLMFELIVSYPTLPEGTGLRMTHLILIKIHEVGNIFIIYVKLKFGGLNANKSHILEI